MWSRMIDTCDRLQNTNRSTRRKNMNKRANKEGKERKKGICLHEIQAQITFISKNSRESCNVIGNFHLRLCVVCTKNIQKQIVCMHACSWNAIDTYFFSLSLVNSLSISAIFHFLHLFFFRMEFLVKKTQTCVSSDDDDDDDDMTTKCS